MFKSHSYLVAMQKKLLVFEQQQMQTLAQSAYLKTLSDRSTGALCSLIQEGTYWEIKLEDVSVWISLIKLYLLFLSI